MIDTLLTKQHLLALAGNTIFARGEAYFNSGAVDRLRLRNGKLHATVEGSDDYKVMLWADNDGLDYDCSCPMGLEGACCKHVVATGLAWDSSRRNKDNNTDVLEDDTALINNYLLKQSKETLANWLLDQCDNDEALYQDLKLRALRTTPSTDIKVLKQAVREALSVRGFVDYRNMRETVRRARTALSMLEALLADRQTAIAAELADYAMQCGIKSYTNMDDSSGNFGDLLHSFSELHLRAYTEAGTDYPLQAKAFYKLKSLDDWGFFAFSDYAPLLSEKEYKVYRKLAETKWAKVPAGKPHDNDSPGSLFMDHYHITAVMEELARYENNIDELIQIKSRDLTLPYHFLAIAELLHADGRHDEALDWAERGNAAFPHHPDSRLVEFLCGEYQRRKNHLAATNIAWRYFEQSPRLETYKLLKRCAEKNKDWPARRKSAIAHLGKLDISRRGAQGKTRNWQWQPGGSSTLIEIYHWEKEIEQALCTARKHGATQDQWLRLAQTCEKDHPRDAAEIYRNQLNDIVKRMGNEAYDRGAAIVKTVHQLMQRSKQTNEFNVWLAGVRAEHKAKRNFMQRLDAVMVKKQL